MTSPATAGDLSKRSLRTLTAQELTVGTVWLDDAWGIITTKLPSAADRVETDVEFKALVIQIQCAMVLRVLNNPDGVLEEAGDDYRFRRDAALSTGALYLSDAEAELLGTGDGQSEGAFTIKPTGIGRGNGYWATPDTWVPLP